MEDALLSASCILIAVLLIAVEFWKSNKRVPVNHVWYTIYVFYFFLAVVSGAYLNIKTELFICTDSGYANNVDYRKACQYYYTNEDP